MTGNVSLGPIRASTRAIAGRRQFVGIFEDTSQAGRFLETFLVASWTEHLRQHQRVTNADYVLQERSLRLLQEEPQITHFVAPRPNVE